MDISYDDALAVVVGKLRKHGDEGPASRAKDYFREREAAWKADPEGVQAQNEKDWALERALVDLLDKLPDHLRAHVAEAALSGMNDERMRACYALANSWVVGAQHDSGEYDEADSSSGEAA